jgi:hypothetical protein
MSHSSLKLPYVKKQVNTMIHQHLPVFVIKFNVEFIDFSKISNFNFVNVPSAYHGQYTMEFWVFAEDINDVTNGVNILWDQHLGMIIMKNPSNALGGYCFPQAYNVNLLNQMGNTINTLQTSATNSYLVNLTTSNGVWIWVRCAVSFPNAKYYLNYMPINGAVVNSPIQTLNSELLYSTIRNDYPYRYFFTNGQKTTIYVQNINTHTKKIFLRNLYAFNDYLPQTYNFQYM